MSPTMEHIPLKSTYPLLPPSLLHSSFVPSSEAEASIRKTIQDIDTILSVDETITCVHATPSVPQSHHNILRMALVHQQAAPSPIRKLPPEILSEIFLFASSGSAIEWPRRSKANIPWLLCEISSYWRTVAISVPGLWSTIRVNNNNRLDVFHIQPLFKERAQRFLDLCLARSKHELLTLSFEGSGVFFLPFILDIFVAHSERWKDVSLSSDMLLSFHSTLAWAKNLPRVPNLQRLYIDPARPNQDWQHAPLPIPLEAYQDAPNLRELSIINIKHPFQTFRVPWSQLTHFSSKGSMFAGGEFARILRHMPNLIFFSTERDWVSKAVPTEPFLLPHLRQLSISNETDHISRMCQFLTVPNLEALSICAVTPFNAVQTVAMIVRSGCQLKGLTLRSSLRTGMAGNENSNVVSLLTTLPALTCLELTVVRAAVFILDGLANQEPSTAREPLLPNLDSLVLEDRLCTSAFQIANALRSRIVEGVHPGSCSINLRLRPVVPPKPYELYLLEEMAENHGMEITILSR